MANALPPPNAHTTPASAFPQSLTASNNTIHVSLTYAPLDLPSTLALIRSPAAGALVTFTGTTRATFANRPVATLSYSAYAPLALRTMLDVCAGVQAEFAVLGVAMVHRLGEVPVGQDSVVVAVAGVHRGECWRAGEKALEGCKARVEVWKEERFGDEVGGGGVWRANRDGGEGVRVDLVAEGIGEGEGGGGGAGEGRGVDVR